MNQQVYGMYEVELAEDEIMKLPDRPLEHTFAIDTLDWQDDDKMV